MASQVSIIAIEISGILAATLNADDTSDLMPTRRRITRKPTLDGGVRFIDQGFSPSNDVINITADLPWRNSIDAKLILDSLRAMLESFPYVQVTTEFGVYKGYLDRLVPKEQKVTVTIQLDND